MQKNKLVITGSSTVAPLMTEIGRAFEAQRPDVRVDVQAGGSSRGIADIRSGVADMGMVSRALNDDEKDLKAYPVARDGICVILNKKNPVNILSDQQVADIYRGKITRWKDVGGRDAAITVVSKAEGRSTLELFLRYYRLKNTDIKASVIIGDNEQGIKTIVGNPNAIAYVSIGSAEFDGENGNPVKRLPMNGVAASIATVKNEKFPLSRSLNLVTKTLPQGLVKAFIDFSQSNAVADLIEDLYFVPITQ